MPVTTSQQIARYYDEFRTVDVTFTREVIKATLLYPKQVFIKCMGYQWPCIVYSSSMVGAKIIANMKSSLNEAVRKANNLISLRFSFLQRDKPDPLSFFVSSKITGYTPYSKENPELNFITINYTQRPPDDLIEILGTLLEANINSKRRGEDRIVLTADSAKKLGVRSRESRLFIDGIPRKCIIRDLSFSGAKVIILGIAKFLVNKEAILRVELDDPVDAVDIKGEVIRFEPVEGRNDIAAFALKFHEDTIPVKYKMRINNYLKGIKTKKSPGETG